MITIIYIEIGAVCVRELVLILTHVRDKCGITKIVDFSS